MRGVRRVLARDERATVERHRLELELLGVEHERCVRIGCFRIARHREASAYARPLFEQVDVQIDRLDQKSGWSVISEVNRNGCGITHQRRADWNRRGSWARRPPFPSGLRGRDELVVPRDAREALLAPAKLRPLQELARARDEVPPDQTLAA